MEGREGEWKEGAFFHRPGWKMQGHASSPSSMNGNTNMNAEEGESEWVREGGWERARKSDRKIERAPQRV